MSVWQNPVSGCPLLDTACSCVPVHPRHPQLCSRRPGILPISGSQALLPSSSMHSSNLPVWPSKPCPRQGALKDTSVVWGSQKCQAGDLGSDQQAVSSRPDPPLSWLTDPQQLWPLSPGTIGWGLTAWQSQLSGRWWWWWRQAHQKLQIVTEAWVKGNGNVSLWRSKRGGVKEAPPPTHPVPEYKTHTPLHPQTVPTSHLESQTDHRSHFSCGSYIIPFWA